MTEDPSLFDAPFFNMTADEAAVSETLKVMHSLIHLGHGSPAKAAVGGRI